MSRTPIMAGNWKMNLDHIAATSLVQDLGEAHNNVAATQF